MSRKLEMMIVQHKVDVLSKFSRVARTAQQPEEGRSSKVLAHVIVTAQSTCSATTLGQRHVHTHTHAHTRTHTHYAGANTATKSEALIPREKRVPGGPARGRRRCGRQQYGTVAGRCLMRGWAAARSPGSSTGCCWLRRRRPRWRQPRSAPAPAGSG